MGKYQDVNCPICNEPLENGEVVVICPDCGAPYHKRCVEKEGRCIFTDLHAQGKSWEAPKKEEKYASDEPKRCTRCGTMNPMDGLFCEVCGTPLNRPESQQQRPNMGQNYGQPGGFGGPQRPFQQMAYDPFNTPFGGVNPDEVIDDIPVKDWAIYVGQNTQYFIPKFKLMSEKRRLPFFNFAAMFFNWIYFLYRKMYLWGVLLFVVLFALEVPALLLQFDNLREVMTPGSTPMFASEGLYNVANACSIFRMLIMLSCGFFTNYLYKYHCMNKIKQIRQQEPNHNQYVEKLTQSGSVSRKLIMVLVIVYFAVSMIFSMLMVSQIL